MTGDPEAWAALGRAIKADRLRQGFKTRKALVQRIEDQGGSASDRSIGSIERGVVPRTGELPPTTEAVITALGWRVGWAHRILNGEDPADVLPHRADHRAAAAVAKADALSREGVLEFLPRVYEFSRDCVALGADRAARDAFDQALQALVDSLPSESERRHYALAAYRPHAEGEGVAADDAARIMDAADDES
ncbi:hypothetical protein [Streptomyces sp. RTd22]|uniref:hypothetical protein n=1 Tax=Streptomyces sp. RTd22 TaxID=1841249 RepID=UPI0007C4F87D|nr:hypothetical protein [Streptomyces sp. RTd22]